MPGNYVLKAPCLWTQDVQQQTFKESCKEIAREYTVYQRLGTHPRLLRLLAYEPRRGISLEYMPLGSLRDYLDNATVYTLSLRQRLQWGCDLAEAAHHLHTHNIFHADLNPCNFVIDSAMRLRIIDFAGSTIDGQPGLAMVNARYCIPHFIDQGCSVKSEVFALGSILYELMTVAELYPDQTDQDIEKAFVNNDFPDLTDVPCRDIIENCWHGKYECAEDLRLEVHERLRVETAQSARLFPWEWST